MSASQVTTDGSVIAPLNITNPAPTFDLAGFQFNLMSRRELGTGPRLSQVAAAGQKPLSTSQQPKSKEDQLKEQLEIPGGPPNGPQKPLPFPLSHFKGAYAGNGFNLIWVPRMFSDPKPLPTNDNDLILQLTTEQWTFGPPLGEIKNRGFGRQEDIKLGGIAYMQTVQDVTNPDTGKGDKPRTAAGSGIHFEPGMWLYVPRANSFQTSHSVVRMASIPHGTTINAQGLVPANVQSGAPTIPVVDTTPFSIRERDPKEPPSKEPPRRLGEDFAAPMNAKMKNGSRVPGDLGKFNEDQASTITSQIIRDPNQVLRNAIQGQKIIDHYSFTVFSGQPEPSFNDGAQLNGGGTTNISQLAGKQDTVTTRSPPRVAMMNDPKVANKKVEDRQGGPNAHAESMSSTWWIETVAYELILPSIKAGDTALNLNPVMPSSPHEAPTPKFNVKAPNNKAIPAGMKIMVRGTQIQYSQTVNLNFGTLTWPHVSVATLVPTDAQLWLME